MGFPSSQQIFYWIYLFLIPYMFRLFDHPQAGIHNAEKPSLTTDPMLLDNLSYLYLYWMKSSSVGLEPTCSLAS
jgi:hypothetical protein